MNREFLAKRLTKFKDLEEIADYIIAEIEKAKKDAVIETCQKIVSAPNDMVYHTIDLLYKQAQDK